MHRQRKAVQHLENEASLRAHRFAEAFVHAAKELLDTETYAMLTELATERARPASGDQAG